jgi:hypothetical protein
MTPTEHALPAGCRWIVLPDGRAVVRRPLGLTDVAPPALLLAAVLGCGWAVGAAPSDGFWLSGLVLFVVPCLGVALLLLNLMSSHHELVVTEDAVEHRWRHPVGRTRTAVVTRLWVRHHPERPFGGGVRGASWELTADHADGTSGAVWSGAPHALRLLGEALHDRTGLPFAPTPRETAPRQRQSL